ncbi:tape measure protein [Serratia fonticola]|uniref:tape measure protein n=1 Tax=Serratia fonticola TaxID=47917 RepID=UPI003AFFBE8B
MANEARVGHIVYVVDMHVDQLLTAQRQVNERLDRMDAGFSRTTRSVNASERSMLSLSKVATALGAALSVSKIIEYADAWTLASNKMIGVIGSNGDLAGSMEQIVKVSNATQTSVTTTTTLFTRMATATKNLGIGQGDLLTVTKAINQSLSLSGATAAETDSAITQLTQGLNRGYLGGQDFNSVVSAAPRLIKAMADYTGKTTSQLKEMGGAGQLSSEVIVKAVLASANAIDTEFSKAIITFSQHMTVAENNIMKFVGESTTVKTAVSGAGSAITTLSENLDSLAIVFISLSAVMGSRFVGALTASMAAQVKQAAATVNQAMATRKRAQDEVAAAAVTQRKAAADKSAALSALNLATAEYNVAKGSAAEGIALANLIRMRTAYTEAGVIAAQANNVLSVSQARLAATGLTLTNVYKGLQALTAPLGGIVGAATLAAGALYYFHQKAEQAKQESIEFADKLEGVISKMNEMGQTKLKGALADTAKSVVAQKEKIADLNSEYERAIKLANSFAVELKALQDAKAPIDLVTDAQTRLNNAKHDQYQMERDLEEASDKLNVTLQQQGKIQSQLNRVTAEAESSFNTLKRDLIDTHRLSGAAAEALASTLTVLKEINAEQGKASGEIKPPVDTSKYDDFIHKQQQSIALLQKEGAEREKLKAVQNAINSGALEVDDKGNVLESMKARRAEIEANAEAEFKLQEAEKGRKKAAAEGDKSANQAENIAQKLANLKQQSELAATSTQELSREQAILRAGQALGAGATGKQIKEAQDYTAAIWDATAALKAQNAVPELKENANYASQKAQLDMLKNAKDAQGKLLISQEQHNLLSEQMELEHQVNLSKIRAQQQTANPLVEARAEIDPVTALANQNAQKLALMNQYHQQEQAALTAARQKNQLTETQYQEAKLATDAQYQALINAQNTQFEQQRTDALWTMLSQQGLGYDMLTSAVDAFAGNASNALTGLITGSMSAEEAMRSLGSTMLNSVVNSLVQVGVEALKNFIIAQTIGNAGQAAAAAAATAAGASALAAWTPAAIAASIATLGSASGTGLMAYQTAQASGMALSIAGMRKNGGPVQAGNMYEFGEGGMFEALQMGGKNYLLPGNNGKVISNKDLMKGSDGQPQIRTPSTGKQYQQDSASKPSGKQDTQGPPANIVINLTSVGTPQQIVDQQVTRGVTGKEVIEIFMDDVRNSGPASRALANKMGTKLRPTGE